MWYVYCVCACMYLCVMCVCVRESVMCVCCVRSVYDVLSLVCGVCLWCGVVSMVCVVCVCVWFAWCVWCVLCVCVCVRVRKRCTHLRFVEVHEHVSLTIPAELSVSRNNKVCSICVQKFHTLHGSQTAVCPVYQLDVSQMERAVCELLQRLLFND